MKDNKVAVYPIRIQEEPTGFQNKPSVIAEPSEVLVGSGTQGCSQLPLGSIPGRGELSWVTLVSSVNIAPNRLEFQYAVPDASRAFLLDVTVKLQCQVMEPEQVVARNLRCAHDFLSPQIEGKIRRNCRSIDIRAGQVDARQQYNLAEDSLMHELAEMDSNPFKIMQVYVTVAPDKKTIEFLQNQRALLFNLQSLRITLEHFLDECVRDMEQAPDQVFIIKDKITNKFDELIKELD